MSNETVYYSASRRLLHWGAAILLVAAVAGVELHESFPKGSDIRNLLMSVHFQFGLLVFVLVWPRLLQTLRQGKPPINPAPQAAWQETLTKVVHLALYAAMAILPVVGVLVLQAAGKPVSFLGLELPMLVGEDKDFSHDLKEAHELVGNLLIGLVGLHVAAAVWHHRILKDDTMLRMLPPRK